jgi:hypothetical protein
MNNLGNIPAMLRVIAREIERGKVPADVGVLTLRKKGSARPLVYGFGIPSQNLTHDWVRECERAAEEVTRLSSKESPRKA